MYNLQIEKLKKINVGIVYIFGSTVQNLDSILSDVDIGVVFTDIKAIKDFLTVYNQLYEILYEALKPKREIDLVFLQQASLNLQENVIKEGIVLYEMSYEFRSFYEEKILNEYLDFRPVNNYFDACMLRRLNDTCKQTNN